MPNRLLAAGRLALLGLWTGVLLVPCLLAALVIRRAPDLLARLWCAGCCRIAGLEVEVHGESSNHRPTLFVANHVSYLDIIVLGSLLEASFVAKSEVRRWPLVGLIARLRRTEFVRRERTLGVSQRGRLAARLEAGDSLILFAEGTSSDGSRVLPFKSTLFAAVGDAQAPRPVRVQPVTIVYTQLKGGLPIVHALRWLYAWYGDMALLPHLWSVLGLPGARVQLRFHAPLEATAFGSRKDLARHAERAVAGGLAAARAAA